MGRIPPDYLPPRELWPERIYTLPEHRTYPRRLNSTEELIDRHVAEGRGDRVALLFEDQNISYRAPLLEDVDKAKAELRTVKHVIVIGGDAADVTARGYLPYGELIAKGSPQLEPVRRDRMAVSVLLFTSGTTGLPKGTVHVMEEALTVPDSFGKYGWRVGADDVIGGPAPLSLAAGYSTQAVIPFRFGAAASLLPRFTPEAM